VIIKIFYPLILNIINLIFKMVDSDTASVLSTLLFDFIIGLIILFGWLLVRKCKGDQSRKDGYTEPDKI
jgi:hypothetical protein